MKALTMRDVRDHFIRLCGQRTETELDTAANYLMDISIQESDDDVFTVSEDLANDVYKIINDLDVYSNQRQLIKDCWTAWTDFVDVKAFDGSLIHYTQLHELALENIERICKTVKTRFNAVFYRKEAINYITKFYFGNGHVSINDDNQQIIYGPVDIDFVEKVVGEMNRLINNYQLKHQYRLFDDLNQLHDQADSFTGEISMNNKQIIINAHLSFTIVNYDKATKYLAQYCKGQENECGNPRQLQQTSLFDLLSQWVLTHQIDSKTLLNHGIKLNLVQLRY